MAVTSSKPNQDGNKRAGGGPGSDAPSDSSPETELSEGLFPEPATHTHPQSWAMTIIATLGVLYTVYFARAVLFPALAALMLALFLRPLIRSLRRYRIPPSISAAIVLILLMVVGVTGVATLAAPVREWVEDAPARFEEVGEKLRSVREHLANLNEVSAKIEQMASDGASVDVTSDEPATGADATGADANGADANDDDAYVAGDGSDPRNVLTDRAAEQTDADGKTSDDEETEAVPQQPIAVEVKQPRLVAGIQILSSTGSLFAELVIMLVLAYFLLVYGDGLINNVLALLPTFSEKRNTVELVHTIQHGISSYLFTVTLINIGLGVIIGIAMWIIGVPNPLLVGVMATLFNFVPFIGAICGVGVLFVISVLAFDSLLAALVPPVVYWVITNIEGNIVTPSLLGRSMSLNPILVFFSLVLWGWMWGIGGAVIAVPLLAAIKAGCDQFESTRPIGTLLGESRSGVSASSN